MREIAEKVKEYEGEPGMYVRFARLKKLLAATSPYEVRCEKIKLIAKNKMEYTFLVQPL